MRLTQPIFAAALMSSAFLTAAASPPHEACKVLTAEHFSKIMGYAATIDATGSTKTTCYYTGPAESGGQFMILTEVAGPQADAMLNRKGSTPPPGSGLVGGTYKQGTVVFSISIVSTDQAKLQALVAEVRHNLQ